MTDFLPFPAALLGILVGVKARSLPPSGPVALAVQDFPLAGYYFTLYHCHA